MIKISSSKGSAQQINDSSLKLDTKNRLGLRHTSTQIARMLTYSTEDMILEAAECLKQPSVEDDGSVALLDTIEILAHLVSGRSGYLRSTWAELVNEALQKAGLNIRVDHRSYERQELALIPGRPKGMALTWASRKLEGLDKSILALGPSIDDLDEAQNQLELVLRPAIGDIGGKSKKATNSPIVSLDTEGVLQLNRDFSYLVAFLMRRLKRHRKLDRLADGESYLLDACVVFVESFRWVRDKVRADKVNGREIGSNFTHAEIRPMSMPREPSV